MNAIIDPRESYTPAYDLTMTAQVHRRGDVTVLITWNTLSSQPCMVLVETGSLLRGTRPLPCIVTLSAAWKWDERTGDAFWCLTQAARFCDSLGFNAANPANVMRLLLIIRDYLEELIRTPPMPDWKREVAAEMLITDNATGKTTEKEVTDHA